jgi:hypothetical protein
MFGPDYRCLIYSMYSNCTPKSAIGPNIVAVVKATAPWLTPVPPSESLLIDCRFELRTACEVCAAREVASAHAIKVLGSDETTKNGNASITSNVLIQPTPGADFKLVVLRALSAKEYIAMLRANSIVDLLISRPLRFLAGSAYKLDNFSPLSLGTVGKKGALDLVEEAMDAAALDGTTLLDPHLDIFAPIAAEQTLFHEWREDMFNKKTCLGPDGKTKHLMWKLVRDEVLTPSDPTNADPFVRQKTVEYLQVQMAAGLKAMRDKKRSIAKHLASQGGSQAFDQNAQAHMDCAGYDATNDRLAESIFGIYDSILRRFPGISMEAASALTQAVHAKRFAPGGYVDSLPPEERHALVEMARTTRAEMRAIDRAHHAELDAYHTQRRKTNAEIELMALIKQYALALSFFDRWKERGVASPTDMVAARLPA